MTCLHPIVHLFIEHYTSDGKVTLELTTCWEEPKTLLVEALPGSQFKYVGMLKGPDIDLLESDPTGQTATIRLFYCVYR